MDTYQIVSDMLVAEIQGLGELDQPGLGAILIIQVESQPEGQITKQKCYIHALQGKKSLFYFV